MSPTGHAICYAAAFVLFLIEAAGLAVWVLVPLWDAIEAA